MKCCVCNSAEASDLFDAAGQKLVTCNSCGMIYTVDFREEESYDFDYFNRENQYVRHWDDFCLIFESLIEKILCFKRSGTLLDVGAGCGTLLHVAERRGFTVKGVEVSLWAAEFARIEKGLDVICCTLKKAEFSAETFDVVVINHVLEHVDDPKALLKEARKVLKPDGLLVVGVPNIGSFMACIARGKWASLRPNEHRWHFTQRTLERLLIDARFKTVKFESRENHPITGWGTRSLVKRMINVLAVAAERSEAMLIFAEKESGSAP